MKDAGFTLYELIITMAVISLLSAIAAPHFIRLSADFKLNSAIRDMQSDLQAAKLFAINKKGYAVINFYEDSYTVFIDNGKNPQDWNQDADEKTVINRLLPAGIYLSSNFPKNRLRFKPTGNLGCRLGSVVLANKRNNKSKTISLSRTGRINVKWK
ncbi:MAG: prepilin-type N-terminal cleavage/methylation domain-containing protein [Deltaproteobacteria bacterium]|nr:prepilin-type N-terminal cleavage/methylation domain-containing protein [Deltaproteobacteria bacterium]